MKNIKYKIFAIMLLFSILLNMCSTVILANNDVTINNVTTNTDNTTSDNTISDNTIKNNVIKNNVIKNDVINNNVIDNNVISNNSVSDNIVNNTSTNNIINNNIEENKIQENSSDVEIQLKDEQLNNKILKNVSNGVQYKTHVQNVGWQNWTGNASTSGTEGKSLRLEAINLQLVGDIASKVKIKYQVHVQNIGWQNWKSNGEIAGTEGKSLRLEAIRIKLETTDDYSVMYRVHVQNVGWQDWKKDGEIAGTEGRSLRLEAIQIKLVPKEKKAMITLDTATDGTTYYSPKSIKVVGWKMANVSNTKIKAYIDGNTTPIDENLITYKKRDDVIAAISGYGTSVENPNPGFEFSIDSTKMSSGTHTIKIVLYTSKNEKINETITKIKIDRNLHVEYKTHVQNIGWQQNVLDGNMSGTSGRELRVEALNIKLINAPSNAGITYRTHVQNIGWQSWKSNGEMAGTSGKSLRIEAIEIKLQNMDKYTVEYQVHIQNYGWSGWYIDGETAGTVGQGKRIEAIRIKIVPKYKRQYKGIDVSEFNHSINWALVKRSGVEFSMIRVGYRGYGAAGNFKEDANFRTNIEAAKRVQMPVGIYFVTQAINEKEAIEEANWVIDKIKGYSLDYPVAIDIERSAKPDGPGRADNLDKNTRTYLAKVFCQTIQSAGYTPIIYTNVDWATNKLDMSQLSAYDTWIASYKKDIQSGPGYNGKYSIWQYTSSGKVDGILGNVDLNICYKKY